MGVLKSHESLFCGCGAVTQGLKGIFEVIAAVDNNPYASESYRVNHPEVNFFEEDITQLDVSKIRLSCNSR